MTDATASQRRLQIAIIGAGLTGLALAERLRNSGHEITVLERDGKIGGLATWHDYGDFHWDRFYHVILPSDGHLLGFIRDIGLADELRWNRTLTGSTSTAAFTREQRSGFSALPAGESAG